MKSFFLLVLTMISLCPASLLAQDSSRVDSLGGPRIRFSETIHDFGIVSQDSLLSYTFVFINNSTDSLHIKGVRPG